MHKGNIFNILKSNKQLQRQRLQPLQRQPMQRKLIQRRPIQHPKFHFVHIPKTAGTTIEYIFLEHNYRVGRQNFPYKKKRYCKHNKTNCSLWHVPAKHTAVNFNNHITFTVIRNPISRVISEYNWSKSWSKKYRDINNFILHELAGVNYKGDCHLIPQYEYIHDSYGNKIPNILRQELLEQDFNAFIKKYDFKIKFKNKRYQTEHRANKTIGDLTQSSIDILHKYYKKDFELYDSLCDSVDVSF